MRKVLPAFMPVLLMLLVPSAMFAQGTLNVSSTYGPVEWKGTTSKTFVLLTPSTQMVQVGDQLRTGPGGTVRLGLPDGSYVVVSENSTLTIQDFWTPSFKNVMNLMLGKVRFYIQKFGGKPNPYGVTTPTALIAVRGTTFEVSIDEAGITEVRCLEGRVAVETAGLPDREVILDEGRKTLVRPGQYPLPPVGNDEALAVNRVAKIVKKGPEAKDAVSGAPSVDVAGRNNDRQNRAVGPAMGPASRTDTDVMRGKPTLKWPPGNR